VNKFRVWLYNRFAPSMIRDRWSVRKLDRLYKRHPELLDEDRHLFESGAAGYEV
jgi:hypothetical protein